MNEKLAAIRQMLEKEKINAVVVEKQNNFSWLTGGRCFVGLTGDGASGALVITKDKAVLLADSIEGPRLSQEECDWPLEQYVWHDRAGREEILQKLTGGNYKTDSDLAGWFHENRIILNEAELEDYRKAGKICAEILENEMKKLKPGTTELELAGALSAGMWANQIEPIVLLIAFDDRIFKYRHPVPTAKKLDRYAMGVICGRYKGLVVSATRLVHIGPVPAATQAIIDAAAKVDALVINATRPGTTLGKIFTKICDTYKELGYPGEEKLHHQGGLAGYGAREAIANPTAALEVKVGQAYAWNPSITGAKCEDTVLVLPEGNEIITHTGDWAYVEVDGLQRPVALVI